jgi:alkanesulfonate monooxygenase SsuD/methylene tetrahydromethanopterin reductase-like flavin-dependent oxidoreductase (luciferase family)
MRLIIIECVSLDRIAPVTVVTDMGTMFELAQAVERCGLWGVGVCDSPVLYGECYPAIAAMLQATSRIRVGTNVTNPTTRHWTVHASSARTMEELAPGRFFLGIASGDGAVHSLGLPPATRAELAAAVTSIKAHSPAEVHVAASGPLMADTAGAVADAAIIGTGADLVALRTLGDRVRASGRDVDVWGLVYLDVVAEGRDVREARRRGLAMGMAQARFSLSSSFRDKNVPEEHQQRIREVMERYDFMHHASFDGNPNVDLFEDAEEVREYLTDRFCVVGTAAACATRLTEMIEVARLAGVWVAVAPATAATVVQRLAKVWV